MQTVAKYCHKYECNAFWRGDAVWTAVPVLVCGIATIKTVMHPSTIENSFIALSNNVRQTLHFVVIRVYYSRL
jgi:hypothetical protein